jgi:hypothetical protein
MTTDPSDELPDVKCPFCPMCGTPPPFIFDSLAQAWCPNEDCKVFMWTPWDTAAQNLADMHEIDMPDFEQPEPPAA